MRSSSVHFGRLFETNFNPHHQGLYSAQATISHKVYISYTMLLCYRVIAKKGVLNNASLNGRQGKTQQSTSVFPDITFRVLPVSVIRFQRLIPLLIFDLFGKRPHAITAVNTELPPFKNGEHRSESVSSVDL